MPHFARTDRCGWGCVEHHPRLRRTVPRTDANILAALAVACRQCLAPAGQICRDDSGRLVPYHTTRWLDAFDQGRLINLRRTA